MIYHVFSNRSNIGDWISAKGIQKLLAGLPIQECLCDEPFIPETIELLHKATENDLIVIGGGGLLMDYFTPFWEAFQAIADKVPFCIWGIGYCDLKYENTLPPASLIEDIIKKSKLTVVRDELSRDHLPHCNLPEPVACPSILVIEPETEPKIDLLHVNNYTTVGAAAYEIMTELSKEYCQNQGIAYRETNNRIKKDSELEFNTLLELYKNSGIVVSSALHGCIIAVAMNKKIIAVSGDRKIDAFMEAVGLQGWVLDSMEAHRTTELLKKIENQKLDVSLLEKIRSKNSQIGNQVKKILYDIKD